ncbi:MAG: DUF3459 domain-containing protein, partial [Clostridia bacterium]|nr:DUF3459 domain-containing protein [Clostridia bacterium]
MLATCVHMMRGTPYIYQGEELGMTNAYFDQISQYRDVESINYYRILLERGMSRADAMQILQARSRDNSRTPMQWDESPNAGFTTGTPWIGIPACGKDISVQAEETDGSSVLSYYRRLIRLRKENPVIAEGSVRFILPDLPGLIAYERTLPDDKLTVLCNFTDTGIEVPCTGRGDCLIDSYEIAPQISGGTVHLRPWEGCVLR